MTHEPVLFTSTMFETANEAFLFCKNYLQSANHPAANHLEGLDPINDPTLGRLALRALHTVQPLVSGEARQYVDIALNALGRAMVMKPKLQSAA